MVWHFRARQKSFPEWFGISALGKSHFPNGLAFPRSPKIISRMVWSFRAWRKSFPEWFGVSAHGESHFPNGLEFPRMGKVVSQMVWHFRAWRKSFPKGFGVSACGESYFPNSLGLIVAKIWNKNLSGFWIYNNQGASIGTVSTIISTYFVLHKKSFYEIKLESKFKTYPFIKIKSEQEIHSCPLINILI